MNKKLLLFTLVALTSITLLKAQAVKWGIRGGVNVSTYSLENKHFEYTTYYPAERHSVDVKSAVGTGFHLGGFEEYQFYENFFLDAGLMFSTQTSKIKESRKHNDSFKIRMSEISLPLWLKYDINNFRPKLGISLDYSYYHIRDVPFYLNKSAESIFGASLGIGCEYHFLMGLFVDANFKYGLTSLESTKSYYEGGARFLGLNKRIIQLGIGYKF